MQKIKHLPFLFLSLLLTASCGKDDDKDPQPQDQKELLIGKNWKTTAVTYQQNDDQEDDIFSFLDPCQQDNITMFSKDGSFEMNEGATKCDAADPQKVKEGKWQLDGSKLTLTITDTGTEVKEEAEVVELSATKLKLRQTEEYQSVKITYTTSFEAQ